MSSTWMHTLPIPSSFEEQDSEEWGDKNQGIAQWIQI